MKNLSYIQKLFYPFFLNKYSINKEDVDILLHNQFLYSESLLFINIFVFTYYLKSFGLIKMVISIFILHLDA